MPPAAVLLFPGGLQDPVESRFRGQVLAPIRQSRHDLAGRQTGEFRGMTERQQLVSLGQRQLVGRFWAHRRQRATIGPDLALP